MLGENRQSVLDLGAGTGGLTRSLVRLAPRVTAVEPDARMRGVLARHCPGVAVVGGLGERLPFVDRCVDGVLASSSWHWMDPAIAGAEVARVLRTGGVFGLLWSGPDRQVEWVSDVLGPRRRPDGQDGGEFRRRRTMTIPEHLPLTEPETTVVRFSVTVDLDDLAGLSGTFSVVIMGGGPEPRRTHGGRARTGPRASRDRRRPDRAADGVPVLADLPDRGTARRPLNKHRRRAQPGLVAPTKSFRSPGSSRTTVPV